LGEIFKKTKSQFIPSKNFWVFLKENGLNEIGKKLKNCMPKNGFVSCLGHGDFAPWNLKGYKNKFLVFDWEEFSENSPFLTDSLYYDFAIKGMVKKSIMENGKINLFKKGREFNDYDVLMSLCYLGYKKKSQKNYFLSLASEFFLK